MSIGNVAEFHCNLDLFFNKNACVLNVLKGLLVTQYLCFLWNHSDHTANILLKF